jgi:group I intron endonuclease
MNVYLLTNRANGKYYVGQTVQPISARLKQHAFDSRKRGPLQTAIRKYGIGRFDVCVLGKASSVDELNLLESLWILLTAATDRRYGYNCTFGGLNHVRTEETRRKLRAASAGRKQSPETIAKRVAKLRGQKRGQAALANLKAGGEKRSAAMTDRERERRAAAGRAILTGKEPPNKGKKGLQVAWNKGIKATEAERLRLVDMRCRQVYTPERRAKTSATMKGRMPAVNLRRMA